MTLQVANCIGKKPILNNMARMIRILDEINIQLNYSNERMVLSQMRTSSMH